ncbi:hypothetical protein ACFWDG_21500 [Peribacillus sp. NPDC060186]
MPIKLRVYIFPKERNFELTLQQNEAYFIVLGLICFLNLMGYDRDTCKILSQALADIA